LESDNPKGFFEKQIKNGDPTQLMEYIGSLQYGAQMLTELQTAGEVTSVTMGKLYSEMYTKGLKSTNAFRDNTEEITEGIKDMNKGVIQATNRFTKFNDTMTKALNNKYYINMWKKGNRDSKVVDYISQLTKMDKDMVSSGKYDAQINTLLKSIELGDISAIETEGTTLMGSLGEQLQGMLDKETMTLHLNNVDVDLSEG